MDCERLIGIVEDSGVTEVLKATSCVLQVTIEIQSKD